MNVRKRPRLELELATSAVAPGALITSHNPSDLMAGPFANGQSLILTSTSGNPLISSSSGGGAQIFLTICGEENSLDDDESQEYYAIKQEPGSELDVQALLPTNLQLPTGCEIYLVKDTSLGCTQTKSTIKIEPEVLSEKLHVATTTATSTTTTIPSCKSSVPAVPAVASAPHTAAAAPPAPAVVLYQRSPVDAVAAAVPACSSSSTGTPTSKLEAYKKRDDKRRATHNEVERRRRDKINCWIFKLKEMLPSLSSSSSEASTSPSSSSKSNPSPSGRTPPNDSKSQILIKACDYIKSMQGEIDTLRDCLREADSLRASNQALKEELDRLKRQQQLQDRFHTAATGRSTFNVTLNSLNTSATSDLFDGIDTTPNLAAVSSLGFGKRGLLIGDYDE
ncbi:upstream stimulatory factor 1 [Drosophila bipectinata]|uniref:upstream stimulatory factor 1 n=1 Tax=Drosophila bipectinata TaxID=42026 RepID=UPI0007E6704C|nr:upstream stimulatory factor 1 [Drosophila bipectinata]